MLAKQLQGAAKGVAVDSDFEYTTLLLHGNGTNGAQNNTFTDGSTNNFTITRNGNTTQGTFSPYGSNWSNYFDGTGDNFSLTGVTAVGNSDATVEFFIFPTDSSVTYRSVFDSRSTVSTNTGFSIFQYGLTIEVYGASLVVSSAASALTINQWNHVALTRSSNTCQLYINGATSGSSATYSSNLTSTVTRIGDSVNQLFPYVGYISNLRVVVGSVVYSGSTYTVPTAPLTAITNTSLLTCQSNRFIDNSTNAFAITRNGDVSVQRFSPFSPSAAYSASTIGGSGYFDGTGDYLTAASNAAFRFGTGNFTIEFWYYPTVFGTNTPIDMGYTNSGSYVVQNGSDGKPYFYIGGPGTIFTSATAYFLNAWNHLAVVRSGSTLSMFLNGSRVGTATNSTDINANYSLGIGGSPTHSSPFEIQGFLSNARLVKGTAVYDPSLTTLTVPTAPLTNITNTSLLCNFTNAGIIDNAMMNDLETVGNAQISTTQSKFGGGSIYMAATSPNTDYLVRSASREYEFGTGNFTIEFWMRPDSIVTNWATNNLATILDADLSAGATSTDWWVIHQNDDKLNFSSNNASIFTSSSALSATTWQHVALVRNGSGTNNLTFYVNGTGVGSVTYTSAIGGNRKLFIGTQPSGSINRWYKGYLDDIRITKGIARYTANFTAPTAPFADQ